MIRRLAIPAALALLLGACATYDSPYHAGQRDRYSSDGYYSDDGYRGGGYDDSNAGTYYGADGGYNASGFGNDEYGSDGYYAGDDSGGDYYFGSSVSPYNDYGYGYQPYGFTFGFGYGGGYYPGSWLGLQYGSSPYGYSPWYRGYGYGYPYYGYWHRRHDRDHDHDHDHGHHRGDHDDDHDGPGPTAGDPPGTRRQPGFPANGSPYVRRLPEPVGTPSPPGSRRRTPPTQVVPEPFATPDHTDARRSPRDVYERPRGVAPPMRRDDRNGIDLGGNDRSGGVVEPGDFVRPVRPRNDSGGFNRATIDRRDVGVQPSPQLQSRSQAPYAPRPFVRPPPPRDERQQTRRPDPPPHDDNDSRRTHRDHDEH